ncbi:MAG: gamma-glutamyltransferase [Gammaproteobacteria bacterium]|nr:gamma-glutamyltransferase [Gammaproteobacteria bacterium]
MFIILWLVISPGYAQGPSANAVASAHPLATQAGLAALEKGGNAFDAAVAITAALAVVEPTGSGLGGGGFWLLHRQSDQKKVMIDGRETAPGFAHKRMYLDENDNVRERASLDGPLAGGIPGIPAGMVYLAMNYGKLPLTVSMAPAIEYADKGFVMTSGLRSAIERASDDFKKYPSSAKIFLPEGKVPAAGDQLVQADLATTLRSIANQGFAGFYQGEMANKIVHGVTVNGGIWTVEDLQNYVVLERRPLEVNYKDIKVVSASPPSSGGIVMGQILKMLEHFDLENMDHVSRAHHVIEAARRAYRDRALFLGDPDFVDIPEQRLLDDDYIEGLALTIDPLNATPSDKLGELPESRSTGNSTTHFSVMDSEGNRVAGTLSVNRGFGSKFVIPGTGVLVNNEMDDFAIKPANPNSYGLIGYEANSIEPRKRPLSSMSPTFVESTERVGILGTPGGSRIITMVLLGVLDFSSGKLPESWVDLPRYHHQYKPDMVFFEKNAFNPDEQQALISRGHQLRESRRLYGNMHAIMWDKRTNHVYAASDKRGEGKAEVRLMQ